ncbi:MAG: hypothetical protein VKO39_07370 [Cyanobacteriota bacterium]|nr:hypothetical protein [Cyanobacteriota bacterium]
MAATNANRLRPHFCGGSRAHWVGRQGNASLTRTLSIGKTCAALISSHRPGAEARKG